MIDRRFLVFAMLLCGGARAALGQTGQAVVPVAPGPVESAAVTRFSDPYMPAYVGEYRSDYRFPSRVTPPPVDPDAVYGFRNPGGVGRMREFYPPGNVFERGDDRVRTARFDNGPTATSRQYQMMAQQVGNQRTRTLYSHIDTYGRPLNFGFGYGLGGYGYGGYGLGGYGYGSRFPY